MFRNKLAAALLITCLSTAVNAESFPHGCEVTGFGYNGQDLIVNDTGNQAFYLIQNRSDRNIEIQRVETKDVFMSPQLTVKLDPSNWAAFASDVQDMRFECAIIQEPSNEKVDCREVLDVCQYPRAKFALSNMGNYWVSSNKAQRQVINDAAGKGIYLRW